MELPVKSKKLFGKKKINLMKSRQLGTSTNSNRNTARRESPILFNLIKREIVNTVKDLLHMQKSPLNILSIYYTSRRISIVREDKTAITAELVSVTLVQVFTCRLYIRCYVFREKPVDSSRNMTGRAKGFI